MRAVAAVLLALAWLTALGPASPARAAQECHTETEVIELPGGELQTVVKEVCKDTGEPEQRGDGDEAGSGCAFNDRQIPCSTEYGVWFGSPHFCYAEVTHMYEDLRGDPGMWQGHTDGSLWMCQGFGPDMEDVGTRDIFWLAGPAAPAVDGEALARQALNRMSLARPAIHTAPDDLTYVGVDTWLWMDAGQWQEVTGRASVPTASVRVTATPLQVTWDLTEGSTTCDSAGRAWVRGMSNAERTSCSHVFKKTSDFQSGGRFPVSAVIAYQVDWTCSGNCIEPDGSLGEVDGPIGQSAMRVGERQSVVVEGG